MATKIGIIAEGPIDEALLPPLLDRIARVRANYHWPVIPGDLGEIVPLRKRGHGGVLESVRRVVEHLAANPFPDHAFYVILLDRKTDFVQSEIRKLIGGSTFFAIGIAIEEIEAWWLADKLNLFEFLGLTQNDCAKMRYGVVNYKPEKDDDPKRTLHELTVLSPKRTDTYTTGNTTMAREFAEDYWMGRVNLDAIEQSCPKGFQPFCSDVVNALVREIARQKPGAV